jgi:archaellum component FlaC
MSDKNKPDHVRKSIRIHHEKIKQIEKVSGGNFTAWVLGLIDKELAYDGGKNHADDVETQIKGEKLDEMMDDALLKEFNDRGSEIMKGLTNSEMSKLIIARAPKAAINDVDHEKSKLSLYEALKRLPDAPDLRNELIKIKGNVKRLQTEYDLQIVSMNALRSKSDTELFDGIKNLCNEIAQKSYELREEDDLRQMVTDGIRILQTRKEVDSASSNGQTG